MGESDPCLLYFVDGIHIPRGEEQETLFLPDAAACLLYDIDMRDLYLRGQDRIRAAGELVSCHLHRDILCFIRPVYAVEEIYYEEAEKVVDFESF